MADIDIKVDDPVDATTESTYLTSSSVFLDLSPAPISESVFSVLEATAEGRSGLTFHTAVIDLSFSIIEPEVTVTRDFKPTKQSKGGSNLSSLLENAISSNRVATLNQSNFHRIHERLRRSRNRLSELSDKEIREVETHVFNNIQDRRTMRQFNREQAYYYADFTRFRRTIIK